MDQDDERDRDGVRRRLQRMIGYLVRDRIPRQVAERNIKAEVNHNNSKPEYTSPRITTLEQLAQALGYKSHTSLYPEKGRSTPETEDRITRLYSIDKDSKCWEYFCNFEETKFFAEYSKTHPIIKAEPNQIPPCGGLPSDNPGRLSS
jgi:hypothetical protein